MRFPEEAKVRDLVADLFVSLDGFASGANEAPFFGYFGPELGAWIERELAEPQILIMGRVTYEALAEFAPKAEDPISVRMTELPKLIFSSGLQEPLVWKNARLTRSPVGEEIRTLKSLDDGRLRSIGSIRLVKSMMELGLVDRLRMMVFPLVLGGEGREPVFATFARMPLKLVATRTIDARVVLLEYAPR
jgi:dihydrofolate reductase